MQTLILLTLMMLTSCCPAANVPDIEPGRPGTVTPENETSDDATVEPVDSDLAELLR